MPVEGIPVPQIREKVGATGQYGLFTVVGVHRATAREARSDYDRLGSVLFVSHCPRRVFPVKRKVLANEDSQLSAATKYEKEACELSDQRISRAIFLRII